MKLEELRMLIDSTDRELVALFLQRMEFCRQVGICKQSSAIAVSDPDREDTVLRKVQAQAGPEMAAYTERLYQLLFTLSKEYQQQISDCEVE